MITLELPWPPQALSPNARTHWRPRQTLKRQYRDDCQWLAFEARQKHGPLTPPVAATVTFVVPDNRRRDFDNLLASIKAAWDGIVRSGLLLDDSAAMLRIQAPHIEVVKGRKEVRIALNCIT